MKRVTIPACLGLALLSGVANAQPFQLIVSESLPGSNTNQNVWKGVRKFHLSGSGGVVGERPGIDKSQLSDAAGVTMAGQKLFVGNRHGNSGAASVDRFSYDVNTDTFTKDLRITGNSLSGVHEVAVRPGGELLAINVNNGFSRFLDSLGTPTANGTALSGTQARGIYVNAADTFAYVAQGINSNLIRYNLANGQATSYSIPNGSGMHFGTWLGNDLVIASFNESRIIRIPFDANGAPLTPTILVQSTSALSVAFSPDGKEMYAGNHYTGLISRYLFDNTLQQWLPNGSFQSGTSFGDLAVLPTVPSEVTLNGTAEFQDFPAGPNGQKISVTFFHEGRPQETIENVTINNNDGTFGIKTSRRGTVTVGIKGSHWLRATAVATITNSGGTMDIISMLNGDCDGNNDVGTDDYLIINGSFDLSLGDAGYDFRGDLNGDDYVGTDDYLILNKNFDKSGA